MRSRAALIIVALCALVALAVSTGPLVAATQASGSVAVIDNARVFEESEPGKSASQQIEANFSSWQDQITTLETELQGLLTQRQQQASIMTADALRALDSDIEQKQVDIQRRRDDAQRQFTRIRDQVLASLEAQVTPVVGQLADELGYAVVLNSATPGLLYFHDTVDVTDQLIARLNTMDR